MQIDQTAAAAAAAERARQEAARRAREEAARQAQAQAARDAQAAQQVAAKKEAAVPDKKEGWLAELTENVVEAATGKITPEAAKKEREAIAADLAKTETPEQLAALDKRASTLRTRAGVSDDPAVQAEVAGINKLDDQIGKAKDAASKVAQLQADLGSTNPATAANARAALLSRPKELTDAVKALGPLKDSPLGKQLQADTDAIAKSATPAKLAEQLKRDPNLANYPPEMAKNLLAMRALGDPALNAAMDTVGKQLLTDSLDGKDPNPLSYDALKQNPDLMRLVAPLQQTGDKATQDQLKRVVEGWGKSALEKSLDGKKGKDGVEDGLKAYQDKMLELAQFGLDPTMVAEATASTLSKNEDLVKKKVEDGEDKPWYDPRGWVDGIADWVKDKVGDLIGFVKDKVGDIAKKAAELFYDKVVDPALDNSALGEDTDTFKNEKTGILGDLVTNRLEVGESAFIRLDANAAISGVKLGAGAQMEIKRVPKLGPDGEPLPPGPDGTPQTELQVKVLCDAQAGLGIEAKFGAAMGKEKDIKGNDALLGASAGGGAEAEAGVRLQTELTFSFDATDPKAIEDMTGFFKETAETGLKAAIPGIGPVLAATNLPDQAEATKRFAGHLETVRVEAGVYANASVNASVTVGSVEEQKNQVYKAGEEPEDPVDPNAPKKEDPKTLKDKATKAAAGELLNNAGMDLGSMEAAIGGDLSAGIERNFKTGETTIYLQAKAEAKASASGPGGLGGGVGADYNRKIAVTLDKDGKIKELSTSEEFTKEQFQGLGRTDIMGRVDSDVLAQVSDESTITVKRSYQNLDDFKGKNPAEIAAQLLKDAHGDNPNLVVSDIKASETQKFELGGDIGGVGVKLTLGRTMEQDVEQERWNETMKAVGRKP